MSAATGTGTITIPAPGQKRNKGRKVAMVGAGSWGTTFAKVLCDAGCDVTILARRPEQANEIQVAKRNSQYLPGINLPKSLQATSDPAIALRGAELVFLAVPSQTLRENLTAIEPHLSNRTVLVSLVKGVEKTTTMRMSEVIVDALDIDPERFQRRDVHDPGPTRSPRRSPARSARTVSKRLAPIRGPGQRVNRPEECGQRLTRPGGRDDERVLTVGDGPPRLGLHRRRRGEDARKPLPRGR